MGKKSGSRSAAVGRPQQSDGSFYLTRQLLKKRTPTNTVPNMYVAIQSTISPTEEPTQPQNTNSQKTENPKPFPTHKGI
jgi:hypothetical protein